MKLYLIKLRQWFYDLEFRKKLVFSYIAVIVIPLLILVISNYDKSVSILKQQLNNTIENDQAQICANMNNTMQKTNEFIRFITFSPYLVEELENETMGSYSFIKKLNSYFEPLIWYNLNINKDMDEIVIYADKLSNNTGYFFRSSSGVQQEDWYQKAAKSEDTVWYFEDEKLYGVRRMFSASQNEVIGVLKFSMNTEYVIENMMISGEDDCGIVILDEDNSVLYEYNKNIQVSGSQLMNRFFGKDSGRIANISGFYCIYEDFYNTDWKMFYYTSVNEYLSQSREILWFSILMCVICASIGFGIIFLFSNYFIRQIYTLSSKMAQVEEGSLEVEIHSENKDEIGQLYQCFGHMLERIRELVEKVHAEEQQIREAELKSLQSLINPHFLYNALSVINWNAIASENDNIAYFTEQLAIFYRSCLNKGNNLTTISKEMKNIKAYIEIQLIMHDNSFAAEYRIDEGIEEYPVVNFILQPIVENAIIHGLDENTEVAGKIVIEAKVSGEHIELIVEDNGVGMEQKQADKLISYETEGYGIKNVNDRVKLYYGEAYGISIQSEKMKGTRVCIVIPKCS